MRESSQTVEWMPFHHPDLSLPVLRRQIGNELIDLLSAFGDFMTTRGRSLTWSRSFPSQTAYRAAMYRLRKAGYVAYRRRSGGPPVLALTDTGKARVPALHDPRRCWSARWTGRWYVLVFDVPEKERHYRDTLRQFLERLRMGWLQRSVWVTPHDVRPDYADLVEASAVDEYSHLFEARTVLGRGSKEIVLSAWDFDALEKLQGRYFSVYGSNLRRLAREKVRAEDLMQLAKEEMEAYLYAMQDDPLLPSALWPAGYKGKTVWDLHQVVVKEVRRRLRPWRSRLDRL
ncbi:MAG: hypothetical protein JXB04_08100 [Kiritimatiellae bacterium]|nr:hypothetical protein [Kiritimatiellia bacterium]